MGARVVIQGSTRYKAMIEIRTIRITEGMRGRYARYLCDMRFVDPDQGTYTTEYGWTGLNYDVCLSFEGQYMANVLKRIERVITERLCA